MVFRLLKSSYSSARKSGKLSVMVNDKSLEERVTKVEIELAEVRGLAVKASEDSAAGQAAADAQAQSLQSFESTQHKILVVVESLAQTQEQHFAELGVTQAEHYASMQRIEAAQLEQQQDVDKLRHSEMRQWAEMQDVRRTQLKHYADHKADFKALKGELGELKGDVGQLKQGMTRIEQAVERLAGGSGHEQS